MCYSGVPTGKAKPSTGYTGYRGKSGYSGLSGIGADGFIIRQKVSVKCPGCQDLFVTRVSIPKCSICKAKFSTISRHPVTKEDEFTVKAYASCPKCRHSFKITKPETKCPLCNNNFCIYY